MSHTRCFAAVAIVTFFFQAFMARAIEPEVGLPNPPTIEQMPSLNLSRDVIYLGVLPKKPAKGGKAVPATLLAQLKKDLPSALTSALTSDQPQGAPNFKFVIGDAPAPKKTKPPKKSLPAGLHCQLSRKPDLTLVSGDKIEDRLGTIVGTCAKAESYSVVVGVISVTTNGQYALELLMRTPKGELARNTVLMGDSQLFKKGKALKLPRKEQRTVAFANIAKFVSNSALPPLKTNTDVSDLLVVPPPTTLPSVPALLPRSEPLPAPSPEVSSAPPPPSLAAIAATAPSTDPKPAVLKRPDSRDKKIARWVSASVSMLAIAAGTVMAVIPTFVDGTKVEPCLVNGNSWQCQTVTDTSALLIPGIAVAVGGLGGLIASFVATRDR